jgi:thioredoxin 1
LRLKRNTKNFVLGILMIVLMITAFTSCDKAAKGTPKLLDLGADKCIPCKEMAPILEELKKEYAGVLEVEFIDVWKPENQQAAIKYGIKNIPTQIFFETDGNELWRHVGFISKGDILKKWEELGYRLKAKPADAVQEDCTDCSGCGEAEESRTCE